MKKVVITCTLVLAMITSLLAACSCGEKVIDIPELEPFTNEAMGISGVVPEGWNETAPGVYARGDMTTDQTAIIQQAAPGTTAEQLTAALLPQLGIEEFPESVGSYESTALTWDLYIIEVEAYRSVTPGLGGEFQFSEDDDGNPIIIIGEGAYEYIFEKVE